VFGAKVRLFSHLQEVELPSVPSSLMIDQIRGVPIRVAPHMAYLQVGAWVLEVKTSLQTARELTVGVETTLYTVLMLPREEGVPSLYGFATAEERQQFLSLLRVPRVGPQVALALLSQYTPAILAEHIRRKDAQALSRVKGIGTKLAQQIILELSGKLSTESPMAPAYQEARAALLSLGFSAKEAEERLQAVYRLHPEAPAEELVRLALAQNS
jgi:Holliday junction DNA helicase RuvA